MYVDNLAPVRKPRSNGLTKYSYNVTVNHVTLERLGKIFEYCKKNLNYDVLVFGYELGGKQGQAHFQVYIHNTDIDNHKTLRDIICKSDNNITCVAFPVKDTSPESEHHLFAYAQKDGHYIKHLYCQHKIECRWQSILGEWHDETFSSRHFDHYRKNIKYLPNFINHIKTWGG